MNKYIITGLSTNNIVQLLEHIKALGYGLDNRREEVILERVACYNFCEIRLHDVVDYATGSFYTRCKHGASESWQESYFGPMKEYKWVTAEEFLRLPHTQDGVNSPEHYNSYPVEVIDMMEKVFGKKDTATFCLLNAFKYRMRAGLKEDLEKDLEKEKWYLNKWKQLDSK